MTFTLPPLPYAKDALAPAISANTLDFHHGKHHAAYVNNLNNQAKGKPYETMSLEDVIHASWEAKDIGVFNNAAQVWNHTFYWNSMAPSGGGKPKGDVASMIDKDFGTYEKFVEELKNAGATQFGSGWAWLALKSGKVEVMKTPNGENPLVHGAKPILGVDVWEHSYYIDYRNRRPDYLKAWVDHLVDWEHVAEMYGEK